MRGTIILIVGFIIVNEKHRQFFQDIVNFYFTYQDNLIKLQQTFFNGTDQTHKNMLVHNNNIDLKLLPYEFNMNDMTRKEILGDDVVHGEIGYISTKIPNNKENRLTNYFMKDIQTFIWRFSRVILEVEVD